MAAAPAPLIGGPYTQMTGTYFPPPVVASGDGRGGAASAGWVGSGSGTDPDGPYIDDGSSAWSAPASYYGTRYSQGRKWQPSGGAQWQSDYSIASCGPNTWAAFGFYPDDPAPSYPGFSIDYQAYYGNAWNGGETGALDSAINNSRSFAANVTEPGTPSAPLGSVKSYPANQLQFTNAYAAGPPVSSFNRLRSYASKVNPGGSPSSTPDVIYEAAWDIYGYAHLAETFGTLEVMFWTRNHNQDPTSIGPTVETGIDFGDGKLWDLSMTPDTLATGGVAGQYSYGIFCLQEEFQEDSGWVDIRAGLRYFLSRYVVTSGPGAPANPLDVRLWQVTCGWEVCSTNYTPVQFRMLDYQLDIA